MDKLLHWSLEAQEGKAKQGPDPQLLAQLFNAGPDEPTLMKEALSVIVDKSKPVEDRETALDNMEMLIESLDNANNLENMKMWKPLIEQLDDENSSIRSLTCWVIGTAVQNNPTSQNNYMKYDGGVSKLLQLAKSDSDSEVQLKALYALSCLLRNCPAAYAEFEKQGGWQILGELLESSSKPKLLLRLLSLYSALLTNGSSEKKMEVTRTNDLVAKILPHLNESSDVGLLDKIVHVLVTLGQSEFEFIDEEVTAMKARIQQIKDKELDLEELDVLRELLG